MITTRGSRWFGGLLFGVAAAAAFLLVGCADGDKARGALGADVEIVYMVAPESPSSDLATTPIERAAILTTVSSADDFAALDLERKLLVIDASAFAIVEPEVLRARVNDGTPVVAVNVPLAELYRASGFIETIRAADPIVAADYDPSPGQPEGEHYSWLYITKPDAAGVTRFGSGQGRFSDGQALFEAQLTSLGLTAKELTREPGGGAAPIESLSTPPGD